MGTLRSAHAAVADARAALAQAVGASAAEAVPNTTANNAASLGETAAPPPPPPPPFAALAAGVDTAARRIELARVRAARFLRDNKNAGGEGEAVPPVPLPPVPADAAGSAAAALQAAATGAEMEERARTGAPFRDGPSALPALKPPPGDLPQA
jgi:hypothetical protein